MRSTALFVLFALSLLTSPGFAQTTQQAAAPPNSAAASPPPAPAGNLTREQYIQRAEQRAARRAGARFDRMDTDHDGVLEPAERQAWRGQHQRGTGPRSDRSAP